jgi:hypothetical protein
MILEVKRRIHGANPCLTNLLLMNIKLISRAKNLLVTANALIYDSAIAVHITSLNQ